MSPLEAPARAPGWLASDWRAPAPALLRENLVQALRRVVAETPRAPALIHGAQVVSFSRLWALVRTLAEEITALQAPPGPVALLMQASPLSVAAWFACGLAGRPFLLLEPGNPPERTALLIAKAGAALVVSDLEEAGFALPCLRPSGLATAGRLTATGLKAEAPAMLFPTSGSTGEPKIIAYASRTLQAKLRASQGAMRVAAGDRVLIAGSHANYGFLHHALVFLLAGGSLCLLDVKTEGLAGLFRAITTQGVRHLRFTPSLFRLAAARPEGAAALGLLQGLRFSGEPFLTSDLDLARKIAPGALIQNVYGSTESALFLWTDRGETLPPGTVPIGRIYPLSDFMLRAEGGGALPRGEMGELVIRSDHHALGDWQEGRIDQGRFPATPRGRLYATGDLARVTPTGDLEILGRADRVVKINGQRVSLDEVESHLAKAPGVGQVAVVLREQARGNPLVAFLTGTARDLRPALAARLPAHMIPGHFEWRESLPLLPGGKTDRKALLASLAEAPRPGPAAGASVLEAIFARLLTLDKVGPDADFFSLGGDSLLLLDLQMEVQARFGRSFKAEDFVPCATLRNLARLIGLEAPALPARIGVAEGAELSFRCLRRAERSRGAAIVMPGFAGGAAVETWVEAGLFADHDLWACDALYARGRTMDDGNWVRATQAAARAIKTGAAPEPALLAGFSIGGYIAWATARHLPGRPRVVMVDTARVHRMPRHMVAGWDPLALPHPVRGLQLHRDNPPGLILPSADELRWPAEEGRITHAIVPTLEHVDLGKVAILARLRKVTEAWLAGRPLPLVTLPPTPGARLLAQWQRPGGPDSSEVEALLAESHRLRGRGARLALLYLAILAGPVEAARGLAQALIDEAPELAVAAQARAALEQMTEPPRQRLPGWGRGFRMTEVQTMDRALQLRRSGHLPPPEALAPRVSP